MRTARFPPYYSTRYSTSPAAAWLDDFSAWQKRSGYCPITILLNLRVTRFVLERHGPFARDRRFSAKDLQQMFASPDRQRVWNSVRSAFKKFLQGQDQWIEDVSTDRYAPLLEAYRKYLQELRGLAAASVCCHQSVASRFLKERASRRRHLADLTPRDVERFMSDRARCLSRIGLLDTLWLLRSFLRFCHDRGELAQRLDEIEVPRKFQGERPPRAIPWELTQQLLASIELSSSLAHRDYAVLYLMAHFGLRTGEISTLTLDCIDWAAQTLRVTQSKTRSVLMLPLDRPALRVLKRYLHFGRPADSRPELFLSANAPIRPLKDVAGLFHKRVRESGLPLAGAVPYGLRHGFAMRLLSQGVGIKAIGDLLGHRSLESTWEYLRLQVDALRDVALPVPTAQSINGRLS